MSLRFLGDQEDDRFNFVLYYFVLYSLTSNMAVSNNINPFLANVLILYPQNGNIGQKSVNGVAYLGKDSSSKEQRVRRDMKLARRMCIFWL